MDYNRHELRLAAARSLHSTCPQFVLGGDCELDTCRDNEAWMAQAHELVEDMFGAIITHVIVPTRKDEDQRVAYRIRAELVCCDIHERLEAEAAKGRWDDENHTYLMPASWRELRRSHDYHDICHFGGWAASIAEAGPGRRYYCPAAGEVELNEGGGFQTCCDNPEGHIIMSPEASDRAGND